jgi:hypothetical protein
MSVQTMTELQAAVRERGSHAYIITVTADGAPHAVYVPVRWDRGQLVADVGARTAANAAARARVSLLYPVRTDGDYSLIVDGAAVVEPGDDGSRVRVTPSKIVLHREGPSPDPGSTCGADCVPLPLPITPGTR